jgi:hypothetical protein
VSQETISAIRAYAGLEGDPGDRLGPLTVSGALAAGVGVDLAVQSFIDALQALNVEMNGTARDEKVGADERPLPRRLIYAVAEVARMLRDDGRLDEAWSIDTAWLAVLAGDIDDVPGHIALERRARG